MKTKINIGTSKGNIVGVEFDKPFSEINAQDIYVKAYKKFGKNVFVEGWCDVTNLKP